MIPRPFLLSVAAAAIASAGAGVAYAAPATLSNGVFREVEVRGVDGRIDTRLEPAAKVMPGDRVVYVLTYRNVGAKPAQGVVVSNPLPAGVEYAGPRDGVAPETSVDGGRSFGPLAQLQTSRADGLAPAALSDVTTLRWVVPGAVPPGGEIRLSYRARLK